MVEGRNRRMNFVKFLIMENLPRNGSYLSLENLKDNVANDFFSIKKLSNFDIFESALEKLNEEQFVFINRGKNTVAATQYGIHKSN